MIFDLATILPSLSPRALTVTRRAPSGYVDGRVTPGTTSTLSISAVVLPVTGRELQRVPEGRRTDETRMVLTVTELKTQTPTSDPDTIAIDGTDFQVSSVEDWSAVANFYKALVIKIPK